MKRIHLGGGSSRLALETAQPPDVLAVGRDGIGKEAITVPSLSDRPASPLAFLLEAYNTKASSLFLITGSSGAGKTSWCATAAGLARARALPVSGLLSPAVMNGTHKVAIELLDLSTSERRCLARRTELPAAQAQIGEDRATGIVTGSWRFDPATIAWGNSVLERTKAKVTELVIIDEIGPLEFEQGQGLQAALRVLDASRYRLACVTLRPSLVDTARRRWPWSQVVFVGDDSDD